MNAPDPFALAAVKLVAEIWREFGSPPPSDSVSGWAGKKRYIAKGPERGDWHNERTPYLVEPMDCMSEASPYERVVMMFATQLGKTEVIYNTAFQRIEQAPQDMMIVQPTLNDAKEHSTQRFMPAVPHMPGVAERIATTRSRDESSTWRAKSIRGGATIFFGGANSARSLASKPLGLAFLDEIDGYPDDVDGEGSPIALVEERMSNFSNRKLLLCSTPTLKDYSKIEGEYIASDQRKYHVPCPHCGEHQVLVWGSAEKFGLKWLKDLNGDPKPETAVYICRHCGASIEEHHKTDMLADGLWIPDRPGAGNGIVAGFWLSKLYSPLGWRSWAWMVDQWHRSQQLATRGDTSKLKTFVNTNLAETWEEQGDKVNQHELAKRAEDYPLRSVPWGACALFAGADVQKDRIEARVKAFGRGEESWTVDRAIFYGDTALAADVEGSPWAKLDEYLRSPLQHASGRLLYILATGIDSGFNSQVVYAFARTRAHRNILAVDGRKTLSTVVGKPSETLLNVHGERIRGLKLWPVGTDVAKKLIYGRMRMTQVGPGYMHFSKELPGDEFEQLTAERLVTRYVKGHPRQDFVKLPGRRNEALDCEVYALAAAYSQGMDRWKEGDWLKYERNAQERELFDAPPPPPALARPTINVSAAAAEHLPNEYEPRTIAQALTQHLAAGLSPMHRTALEYVRNTAGTATVAIFNDDHDPVGPALWSILIGRGLAQVAADGSIALTDAGASVLAAPPPALADPKSRPEVLSQGRISLKGTARGRA